MKNLNDIQQALINIFKVSIKESSLKELVKTCHLELLKLLDKGKADNFYLALYRGNFKYSLPYYRDEKDNHADNEPISLKGGLTDFIRRTGKTGLIDGPRHDELIALGEVDEELVGTDSFQWVGAPLIAHEGVLGVLVVQSYSENIYYTAEDVQLVDYVSQNIALAIERKKNDRELREYRQNLEEKVREKSVEIIKKNARLKSEIEKVKRNEKVQKVLYNISEAKSKAKNLKDLLSKIHEQVETLMQATNFYVAIVEDKDKGLYRFPYIVDENPEELVQSDEIEDLDGGLTHYVLVSEMPLLADRRKLAHLEKRGIVRKLGKEAQSWLGIPLKTDGGEILGVVAVQSYTDPRAYNRDNKRLLSIVSTTIADAVKYKQLEEEKETLEEKLVESQKMEAVGILAAGVAHEFNNLLSIIIGHAYNGMSLWPKDSGDYKRYSKIEKTSERAAELIEKLMIFAQKRERGRHFVNDMAKAIDNTVFNVTGKPPGEENVFVDITEELWPVKIDKEEIDDVLFNVLDNALRAIEGKEDGHIGITAANFIGRPVNAPLKETFRYIYLKVEDNGYGMSEETRSQVFNPFFTTREPGEGTGMGLAIVYTIVREYYGCIEVESKKGEGTTVHIYIPTSSFLS